MIKEITGEWPVNNNVTVEHPTKECSYMGLCAYPFCEHNLDCNPNTVNVDPIKKEVEVKKVGSVKQYFDYQEELNTLRDKISKIEDAQKEIYENIKTDITSVFLAYDYSDLDFKIILTQEGIKIELYVQIYNDYQVIHPINTKLFYNLDELMGVSCKMNICDRRKIGGNQVYTLELTYEL